MKGTIKAYSNVVSAGVINGDDGKTYRFNLGDWTGQRLPEHQESVSFSGHSHMATKVENQK